MHKKMLPRILSSLLLIGMIMLLFLSYTKLSSRTAAEKEMKSINILTYKNIPLSTLDGFHTLYPDYKINIERYSKANYLAFLDTKLNQDNSIDIIELPAEAYSKYAASGTLLPLTSMALFSRIDSTALHYLQSLSDSEYYYGVPYQSNYLGIWYNASLFDKYHLEPPDNLEHFLTACEVFSDNGIPPLAAGLADDDTANNLLTLLTADAFASCTEPVDVTNGFSGIMDPAYLPALETCYGMLDNGYLPESCLYMTDEQAFQAFLDSSYAMAVSSENSISMINDASLKQIDIQVCGFYVSSKDASSPVVGVPVDSVFGISSQSPNIDICKLFLDYYTQYNTVLRYIEDTHTMTTIQNYSVSPALFNSWYMIKRQPYYVPAEHFYLSPYLCGEDTYSLPRQLFYNLITAQEFIDTLHNMESLDAPVHE